MSLLCAANKLKSNGSDIYSNGYERVKKSFCRRLSLRFFSPKWKPKVAAPSSAVTTSLDKEKSKTSRSKTKTRLSAKSKGGNISVVHRIVVDQSLTPQSADRFVGTKVCSKSGRNKFSPNRYLKVRGMIAPGDQQRSYTQNSSDHIYMDAAVYNEIDELDTSLDSWNRHVRRCSGRHHPPIYDTPDLDKKFSTTCSRDGFSQLASYRLDRTGIMDEEGMLYWDSGDRCSHIINNNNNNAAFQTINLRSPDVNQSNLCYTCPFVTRARNASNASDDYESGGGESYSRPNNGATHVYSGIDMDAKKDLPPLSNAKTTKKSSSCASPKLSRATPTRSFSVPPVPPGRRPSTSSDTSSPNQIQQSLMNTRPYSSQMVYEDPERPVENVLNYSAPPSFQRDLVSLVPSEDARVPSLDTRPGSPEGGQSEYGTPGNGQEGVAEAGGGEAHYEYAEPGEANAWYYQRVVSGEAGGVAPSDSDSLYTEGGGIRYHVITMRPRLGSDGGSNFARQQDYQGRFGPYSCVHLYINEEAIRAHEDRHSYNALLAMQPRARQSATEHIYDIPPFETPQSLPQLQFSCISQPPSGFSPEPVTCRVCYLRSANPARLCLSSSSMLADAQLLAPRMCSCRVAETSNHMRNPADGTRNLKAKSGGATSTFLKFFSHLRKPSKTQKTIDESSLSNANHLSVSTSLANTNRLSTHSPLPAQPLGSPTSNLSGSRFANSWNNPNSTSSLLPPHPGTPSSSSRSRVNINDQFNVCDASNNNNSRISHFVPNTRLLSQPPPSTPTVATPVGRNSYSTSDALNRMSADIVDSEHYYSEVQYYQNAYEQTSNSSSSAAADTRHCSVAPYSENVGRNCDEDTDCSTIRCHSSGLMSHRRIYSEPNPRPSSSRESLDCVDDGEKDNAEVISISSCEATYDHLFERSQSQVCRGADKEQSNRAEVKKIDMSQVNVQKHTLDNDYSFDYTTCSSVLGEGRGSGDSTLRGRESSLANHIYQEIVENSLVIDSAESSGTRSKASMVSVQIQDYQSSRLSTSRNSIHFARQYLPSSALGTANESTSDVATSSGLYCPSESSLSHIDSSTASPEPLTRTSCPTSKEQLRLSDLL